jgi:hypothetical protein
MKFDPVVSLGAIVTVVSVLIAAASLAWTWLKDRRLREREYADRVRRAAISALIGLERWRELALSFYEDIQPLLTDADVLLLEKQDVVETRDSLWRALLIARRDTSRQFTFEHLEATYQDLYVYDPSIHARFTGALDGLKVHDRNSFGLLQQETQRIILEMNRRPRPFASADLGNPLRNSVRSIGVDLGARTSACVLPFREMVLGLIKLKDREIIRGSRSEAAAHQPADTATPVSGGQV